MATTTTSPTAGPRLHLGRGARRAVLSAHVISSVGLLGASSALLALAIAGATTADAELERGAYRFVVIFGKAFGIPLSFSALLTGIVLGLGSKWGVLRYPWVTAKLVLLVTTILCGAIVIGPLAERLIDEPADGPGALVVAAVYNVLALLTSTVLSVYKPGGRRRR
jgi:uncharacterized membrane protein